MKYLKRSIAVLLFLAFGIVVAFVASAIKSVHGVGFQAVQLADPAGGGFTAGIWYPTAAATRPSTLLGLRLMRVAPDGAVAGAALPLIAISHGNGGGPGSHADLAMALADAGYVVIAPMHAEDNYLDQSAVGSGRWPANRQRELRLALDYMLGTWPSHGRLDAKRIGAFGFSAGGFTVLSAVGARPDLRLVASHCAARSEFACIMLRQAGSPLVRPAASQPWLPLPAPDPRIKAAVVAAPGLGFTMTGAALAAVSVPVQLWSADRDETVPYASNAGVVRAGLGERAEFHSVPGARHLSFLVPCALFGPPALCADADGFDRDAFHDRMNAQVVRFFDRRLR